MDDILVKLKFSKPVEIIHNEVKEIVKTKVLKKNGKLETC